MPRDAWRARLNEAPDPEEPDRIIVTKLNKNAVGNQDSSLTTYSDWTATTWTMRDQRGVAFRTEGNPESVNP